MPVSRRRFLQNAATVATATAMGFGGLRRMLHPETASAANTIAPPVGRGFGTLKPDPAGLLDLPAGFSYRVLSQWGQTMDDGLRVPARHDGMAAFPGPEGHVVLVRNHEVIDEPTQSGFGRHGELLDRVDRARIYDAGMDQPIGGGTTTVIYDPEVGEVRRHFLSLAGTCRNCAGGPTPWNTWISCEESVYRPGEGPFTRDHGYPFEVPADPYGSLVTPRPLVDMGRFNHEAVAVDPKTGIVYQTEDRDDGLFYRFLPNHPGELSAGGRLQALVVTDRPRLDTRNWSEPQVHVGDSGLRVQWVDLTDVQSPGDDLRYQGRDIGAACFARGEGAWFGRQRVFFACTNGGAQQHGQIFAYKPSPYEGTEREAEQPGSLELFVEPNNAELLRACDNLTVAPWGDLYVCEDGRGVDRVVVVSPTGEMYPFAHNARNSSELCGVCFSPDGRVMFVNMQETGITLAVHGPFPLTA